MGVGLGGGLDSVGSAAEVDGVEIVAQDRPLVLRLGDFQGQEGLFDLPWVGGGLPQIVALGVLLGDGRSPLTAAGGHVVDQGPGDAPQVDARVGPESSVLRGDHGVPHVGWQGGAGDDLPVLAGKAADGGDPVAVVDRGFLRQGDGFGRGDGRPCVGDSQEAGHAQEERCEERKESTEKMERSPP